MIKRSLKLSVVIVNYNSAKFLESCLKSLQPAITNIKHEIIIVDNASTDMSSILISNLPKEIRVISNNKNVGFAAANNQAMLQAKGKFILLLNPDTEVGLDSIQTLLKFAEQSEPEVGAFGPTISNYNGAFQRQSIRSLPTPRSALYRLFPWVGNILGNQPQPYLPYKTAPSQPTKVECLSGSAMMLKASALDEIGLLDENFFMYGEDVDLCKRLIDAGWESWFVPSSPIMHYGGGSSEKHSVRSNINFYLAAQKYYVKHFPNTGIWSLAINTAVIIGIWVKFTLDLAGLLFRRRIQAGSVKPRP